MRLTERLRIGLKGVEFHLTPTLIRMLAPLARLPNPFRDEEHRLGCVFIHVPKSGGTSIARALFEQKSRHICIARYFAFDSGAASKYFKFGFVRNPWDRFHSAYFYLAHKVGADPRYPDHRWATHYLGQCRDFADFVKRMASRRRFRAQVRQYIHFRDQADWLWLPGRGLVMDFVGRYEALGEDFEKVCSHLGVLRELPHERKGAGTRSCADDYTPAAVDFVGSLYARDVRLFNYQFPG